MEKEIFAKLFKKVVIDRNFRLLNKENIKKFAYYSKNDNLSMLENRVDNYIERNTGSCDLNLTFLLILNKIMKK